MDILYSFAMLSPTPAHSGLHDKRERDEQGNPRNQGSDHRVADGRRCNSVLCGGAGMSTPSQPKAQPTQLTEYRAGMTAFYTAGLHRPPVDASPDFVQGFFDAKRDHSEELAFEERCS
jgi:hypothetical protein